VLVTAMFLESALVHGGLLGYQHVVFFSPWVFKFPPEIWRFATAFLLTGGGFSFIIDLYFSQCFLLDATYWLC
jgi:Derlin-2/3